MNDKWVREINDWLDEIDIPLFRYYRSERANQTMSSLAPLELHPRFDLTAKLFRFVLVISHVFERFTHNICNDARLVSYNECLKAEWRFT